MGRMTEADYAIPDDPAEFQRRMADPMWRICSGALYKIMIKGEDGDEATAIPFKPNRAQRRFMARLWRRNVILKARQLGFTTLICILWLDHALFNENQRCGIIAQDLEAAQAIFSDKVKFAYENLPPHLIKEMPLKTETTKMLVFAHNNSAIRVATSMRSGTIHRLHISEFGKICAKTPEKAREVITGSIPAVPATGILVIESTAEGQEGSFYKTCQRAEALYNERAILTPRDYRFHFFPWYQAPEYVMDPRGVIITDADHTYFDTIEAKERVIITTRQRAWYVATRDADFAGEDEKMWQEYPSTSEEAFKVSTEGTYYATQLIAARKAGRIGIYPFVAGVLVNTFWDIGNTDGTAVWFHQHVQGTDRFIKFIEGWGEPYAYFVKTMQETGWVWGVHHLPHDGAHVRQGQDSNLSPLQMLENLGLRNVVIVPQVAELQHGIQATRDAFSTAHFDKEGCSLGIAHLEKYHKKWNTRTATWSDQPEKLDGHSEAADGFRQWAQAKGLSFTGPGSMQTGRSKASRRNVNHRTV